MAIFSGLFNSINGDRKYNATWFARYFATFIGNGVFPNPSTGLQVVEATNMTTVVKPGDGWINGYFIVNDGDYTINHDNADGVLNRIDRVVLRLDYSGRVINVLVKKGIFASNPVAPTIQRDADYYELVLADVFIKAGTTEIIQGNVTDQRLNSEVCGIVHGLVKQVDTTTIFNQYQSWYEQMTGEKLDAYNDWFKQHQDNFNDWFVSVQDILDSNVAGNLLLLIQQNERDIKSLIKTKTDVDIPASGWVKNPSTERFEYAIQDIDIDSDCIVDVNIQLDYLDLAKSLLPVCTSSNGAVVLYSLSIVNNDIRADYRVTREVV